MSSLKNNTGIALPITDADRQVALNFAEQQVTEQKREQVYRNTLAVLIVRRYLEIFDISSDLSNSYSWNVIARSAADIADLYIPEMEGRLECRPIQPGDRFCFIPQESWEERIGFVIVQLEPNKNPSFGTLLGCIREISEEKLSKDKKLSLSNLNPSEDLFDWVLKEVPAVVLVNTTEKSKEDNLICLQQWLERVYEMDESKGWDEWQSPRSLISTRFLASQSGSRSATGRGETKDLYSQVNSVSRAKVLTIGAAAEQSIVLVVQITSKIQQEEVLDVRLRLFPDQASEYLPQNLKITIFDENGKVFHEVQIRKTETWVEFELLDCRPKERFSLRAAIEEESITENFVV